MYCFKLHVADVLAPGCDVSIGDSNVVDGADVNPPSADAGPDPCVLNHDVVPVVPDVPVSTEAMMHCTARRGIVEIPDRPLCSLNHWSWIRSINVQPAIEGEHEAKYGFSPVFIHQHTGHHAAHSTSGQMPLPPPPPPPPQTS